MVRRSPSWLLLLLYFTTVVVAGCLLSPWLFALGKWYAEFARAKGWESTPVLGSLAKEAAKADFQRYFNRAVLVSALALLWPAARLLKLGRGELPGFRPDGRDLRDALVGFLLAGGLLLAMGWYLLSIGVFRPNPKADWGSLLLTALVAAVAVSLIEEWLFRGAFTAIALRTLSPRPAMAFIALLFAVLHFMEPPEHLRIPDQAVNAGTGFQLAGVMFGRLADPDTFAAAFLTLLTVGLMLGWARQATGKLWLGIGLHAGWVFALKGFSGATRRAKNAEDILAPRWMGDDLRTGLLPLLFLSVTALLLWFYLRGRVSRNRGSAARP